MCYQIANKPRTDCRAEVHGPRDNCIPTPLISSLAKFVLEFFPEHRKRVRVYMASSSFYIGLWITATILNFTAYGEF